MLKDPNPPHLPFILIETRYRHATSNPESLASPATYLLISKALIAPLAVDEADALAALETVVDAVTLAGLTEEETGVVIVALADLVEDEITIVLLFAGLDETY